MHNANETQRLSNTITPQYYYAIADSVTTMYSSIWATRGYDVELRLALTAIIASPVCGVAGHVAGRTDLALYSPLPKFDIKKLKLLLSKEVQRALADKTEIQPNKPIRFRIDETISAILVIFPDKNFSGNQQLFGVEDINYCFLMYVPNRVFFGPNAANEEDQFVNFHANATIPLLFDVFHHRERRFAPFAVSVSERYWEDSHKLARAIDYTTEQILRPPWEGNANVHRTATLCVDLRKSTFCMEHSDQAEKFGRWLDSLVRVVTKVCHAHGGIFDKFTGDGGLVHFLDRECMSIYGNSALSCAVDCALELQIELIKLLESLRTFLRFDSGLLGAGVGIDVADAYWSLDHRDNPIVVGKAVVGSCRVCDSAKAGKTRLSNIACKLLPQDTLFNLMKLGLKQVSQSTKELDKEMDILVWEF